MTIKEQFKVIIKGIKWAFRMLIAMFRGKK
jgi:hypothetical protein